MENRNSAVSTREYSKEPVITEFLWWLSTAEKEILKDCRIDRNRYSIIGMTVLCTWVFATLSWTYFFYTAVHSWGIAVLLGLLLGFIILSIDRALIKGITRANKKKFMPLLFRSLLALTIGTFMAQPAVLYLFEKEIKLQISHDNEKRKMQKRAELDQLFLEQRADLQKQTAELKNELDLKSTAVEKARSNYLAEADGSGGTGRIGISSIALAKKAEYDKLQSEYQQLSAKNNPLVDSNNAALHGMEEKIKKEEAEFAAYLNDGFLTRIEALANLLKTNSALQLRYYLIIFILMLIELMPVIAKTFLPSGSYDEKAMLREEQEILLARQNHQLELELKERYNRLAFDSDRENLDHFFSHTRELRKEKMNAYSKSWREEGIREFDALWKKLKTDILSKQEP